MKRVLLINARTMGLLRLRPTGLEYVAEALVNEGYGVDLIDLALEDDFERPIEERIKSNSFFAVGISIFNTRLATKDSVHFCLPEIREIVSRVRSLTDAPVILGGFGFSIQPKEILSYVDGDYGVSGCGVPAILTLLIGINKERNDFCFIHYPRVQ